tara:strand:- start:11177 stop:11344 length:168 start_codon:yes stop_codon:yes gene_type:complete
MFEFAFSSISEAIYMNGHGIYVWTVVLIVITNITYFFINFKNKIKKIKKKLDASS